jgi:uncharacterized membrane protein
MPFCSHCGGQVGEQERFCARCGARQPGPAPPPPAPDAAPGIDPFPSLPPRTVSILCYVPGIGWIFSILVLASRRFRHDRKVRFHAFQGLYLFVAWLMNDWVIQPLLSVAPAFHIYRFIQAALLVASVFMIVKAAHDETYALPLFGELAQRSVAED